MPVAADTTTPRTEDVAALVQRWLVESETHPVEPAAQRLSEVLKDPNGLAFTVGFVDGVMRPEDLRVAGRKLAELSDITPALLPLVQLAQAVIGHGGPQQRQHNHCQHAPPACCHMRLSSFYWMAHPSGYPRSGTLRLSVFRPRNQVIVDPHQ